MEGSWEDAVRTRVPEGFVVFLAGAAGAEDHGQVARGRERREPPEEPACLYEGEVHFGEDRVAVRRAGDREGLLGVSGGENADPAERAEEDLRALRAWRVFVEQEYGQGVQAGVSADIAGIAPFNSKSEANGGALNGRSSSGGGFDPAANGKGGGERGGAGGVSEGRDGRGCPRRHPRKRGPRWRGGG